MDDYCVIFKRPIFIPVDNWRPECKEDELLKSNKGAIFAPVTMFLYGEDDPENRANCFILSTKKCYNSDEMRPHMCRYINYFERYYDRDKEYFTVMARMKYFIDYEPGYTLEMFRYDIERYILRSGIFQKVQKMVADNYHIPLSYKNPKNPALEYTEEHAMILMHMSILMNLCIPLLTHFAYIKKVENVDDFLLEVFDKIFALFPVDMFSKFYETSITNIREKARNDEDLWAKQNIRGINVTSHAVNAVRNIILNLMPKYVFEQNVVSLNFVSIKNCTKYTIDIEYEYAFLNLSSSKRDEDATSEFDKFEASLIRQNEALLAQNMVNAEQTMVLIDMLYGPFRQKEIDFYVKELGDYDAVINPFQKKLIFNLFYKYFGNTESAKAINRIDYIKLMITAKRLLMSQCMVMLPYVISSRVDKIVARKSVNKKDLVKIQSSPLYPLVLEKYNERIVKEILGVVATILSGDFTIIDYDDPNLNGKRIEIIPDIIIEEFLMYVLLV